MMTMVRRVGGFLLRGAHRLTPVPNNSTHLGHAALCSSVRTMVMLPSFLRMKPRDFSLPNASWGPEILRLYDHYNSLCEVETEGGEKVQGPWMRVPSYNGAIKYSKSGFYLSKITKAKARLFTRNFREEGATFEYVMFINKEEQRCICIFQAGHLLEGPPGHVHGGAIATMIDSVTGTLATALFGPTMTANLNINYRNPIQLGGTVLLESFVEKREGRKTFLSCKVSSTDGSKQHTDATALFISINILKLLTG